VISPCHKPGAARTILDEQQVKPRLGLRIRLRLKRKRTSGWNKKSG